jgi:uncharacterized membrane protein (GlpM family)
MIGVREYITHFVFGGILFTLIHYIANILDNTALAAIVAFLPISILTGYIIIGHDRLLKYYKSAFSVCLGTVISYIGLFALFYSGIFSDNVLIFLTMLLWGIIQWYIYKIDFFLKTQS